MSQKKKWSASKKFEIALLALKGETTLNEICKRYEVAASQVHAWDILHKRPFSVTCFCQKRRFMSIS